MSFERFINRILTFVFGVTPTGDRNVWFHWQNLNEKKDGSTGWPYEGRCWLHVLRGNRCPAVMKFSWHLFRWAAGFGISSDREDHGHLTLSLAIPLVGSFWFSFYVPGLHTLLSSPFMGRWNEKYDGYKGSHRYTPFYFFELRVFDKAIWWTILKFDWGSSSKMPKWMSGCWHPLDTIFGRMKYTKKVLGKHNVQIPMPEGCYPGTVELDYSTWKRPRLPWTSQKSYSAYVSVDVGIPHEGKGESEYNCGEDALFGISRHAETVEEAIAAMVQAVLESRRKYNGSRDAKYPTPAERIAAVTKLRAASAAERAAQQNQAGA